MRSEHRRQRLIPHSAALLTFLAVALVAGCAAHRSRTASPSSRRTASVAAAPPDPWIITTTSPDAGYHPTYLGNGYLGQVMDAAGLGITGSGASQAGPAAGPGTGLRPAQGPQPASLAGLYNQGHLVTLPPLFPLGLQISGAPHGWGLAQLAGYSQSLDMRRGLLITRAAWNRQTVTLTAFVARDNPAWAVCRLVAPPAVSVSEAPTPPPGPDLRPAPGNQPGERSFITTQSHRRVMLASRLLSPDGAAPPGAVASTLVTGLAAEGGGGMTALLPLSNALAVDGGTGGVFEALEKRHEAAWQKLWASDIEIEGNPADQQLVHALMYQLLSSVRAGVNPAPGFPPMGLSNPAAFGGHVFWDADTWIFPALLPLHPDLARTILDYRFRTLPGAKANAAAEGGRGASYAWESADTGREVATLETSHGRHVTADVARAFWQYYLATGDRDWLRQYAWPVLSATAGYWLSRAIRMPSGGTWQILHVSTPDENAGLVNNSAWTNYGARQNLRAATQAAHLLGLPADPRWEQLAAGLLIPRDPSGMILEYSGYKGQPAKQADTLLLLFPGDMPLPRAEQERMYQYYVNRTIRVGPAMTESVNAVIAARLGQPEEAYRRFRASVDPFVRPPYLSFSEKRTRDNLQFLTGAAGALQAVLYGFAGLRLEDSPTPVFHPQLPAAWSGLILHGLAWRGRQYNVTIRRGQPVRLTRR